jgi:hypothetical protein
MNDKKKIQLQKIKNDQAQKNTIKNLLKPIPFDN